MERNERALGRKKTLPKMCFGQHLLASENTAGWEQGSLEGKSQLGGAVRAIGASNIYLENHLLSHYENMFSPYLI